MISEVVRLFGESAVCLSDNTRGLSYARDAVRLSENEIPARQAGAV